MSSHTPSRGGFLPSLPSPAPTNASPRPTIPITLPHPRASPLRPSSQKESSTRRFVDAHLLHISRRFVKKFQAADAVEHGDVAEVAGYTNFGEAEKDFDEVVGVLWLSGTPTLQIPYFLNIALSIASYLSSFPPAPIPTFSLLRKLDHVFASLLKGRDIQTEEVLPGFGEGERGGMSRTDMVRCKSLVEATRVVVVEVMTGVRKSTDGDYGNDTEDQGDTDMDTDDEMDMEAASAWDDEEEGYDMDVARVYEKTLVQLGKLLGNDWGYNVGGGG